LGYNSPAQFVQSLEAERRQFEKILALGQPLRTYSPRLAAAHIARKYFRGDQEGVIYIRCRNLPRVQPRHCIRSCSVRISKSNCMGIITSLVRKTGFLKFWKNFTVGQLACSLVAGWLGLQVLAPPSLRA